ncbi:MAG: flagellin [Selenomonadaceae bacterium]|nr:flagellin [Selenomonadaceae bacterium]
MPIRMSGYLVRGADGLTTIMNNHSTEMSKSMERVSSGLRINHSGDDAAGKAISEKMLSQIRSLDQSQQNTQSANSLLGVAEAAVTSIVDVIQQMKTRALQGANDTLTTDERKALQYELEQLSSQIDASSLVSQSGRYLLRGDFGSITETLQDVTTYAVTDENGDKVYDDDGNEVTSTTGGVLTFDSFDWEDNPDQAMHFQTGPDRGDSILVHLGNMTKDYILKDVTLDVSTSENAMQTYKDLDKSLSRALFQQVEIATVQERLDSTMSNLQETSVDTTAALSTIQDADMAKEMTNFVKHNVLMQATQAMMAQANTTMASFIDLMRE